MPHGYVVLPRRIGQQCFKTYGGIISGSTGVFTCTGTYKSIAHAGGILSCPIAESRCIVTCRLSGLARLFLNFSLLVFFLSPSAKFYQIMIEVFLLEFGICFFGISI